MKKLFSWKNKEEKNKTSHHDVSFRDLSKSEQEEVLKKGAHDFATRFEDVMRELSNG